MRVAGKFLRLEDLAAAQYSSRHVDKPIVLLDAY